MVMAIVHRREHDDRPPEGLGYPIFRTESGQTCISTYLYTVHISVMETKPYVNLSRLVCPTDLVLIEMYINITFIQHMNIAYI